MKEYQKRNTNKDIRQEYEQKQKKKGVPTNYVENEKKKDVYRQNYKYQAGQNAKQINTHGDPLLQ